MSHWMEGRSRVSEVGGEEAVLGDYGADEWGGCARGGYTVERLGDRQDDGCAGLI